jgi:outer membrane protein OmpA-like peptidoglycan-associated protein
MLSRATSSRGRVVVGSVVFFASLLVSSSGLAQSNLTPKWDLFVGYQWENPGGNVPFGDPNNPVAFKLPAMAKGFGSTFGYNFDPHWGLEFDLGHDWGNGNYETTGSVGPRLMWRGENANFFLHTLASYNRLAASGLNPNNGIGAILGGGLDIPFAKGLSLRLFEADYVWAKHNYADAVGLQFSELRRTSFNGIRLRSGLVFNWGGAPELTPAATCSVQPSEVMVGEPITATASASNFNPKHEVSYSWNGTGGQVSGKGATASIDTTNAAPGSYTVTAHVTDPKAKKNNEAGCSANYTVKPLPPKNPPTISCSANPASVVLGATATITCNASSPDGVPVTVGNWNASAGTISSSGSTATLETKGASPGAIAVSAAATDSRGLTTQGSTQVAVENPPPPPVDKALEARLALGHSVYFPTAMPPVKDPNAGLLSSQQQTLIALANDFRTYLTAKPDAHLILEGHADPRGAAEYNQALSERRSARVKSFLVEHGVPESAIDTQALGAQHNLTPDEVRASVEQNPELTKEERARVLRNMRTIILASNRRVDIRLSTTGQISTRQFPFNATDALTLIGGRTPAKKAAPPAAKRKKPAPKKP